MLPKPAAGDLRTLPERRRYGRKQREFLRSLVTDAVIGEHRRAPQPGQRSEALERLMVYFQREAAADGYAVLVVKPFEAYRLVENARGLGLGPRALDDQLYASPEEAEHGLFLRRIHDLFET